MWRNSASEGRRRVAASRTVRSRIGKNKEMIKEEGQKDGSRQKEGDGPGGGDIVTASFEVTGKDDESALGPDRGDAVEGRSHPDKGGLEMLRKPEHVKTVGGDVMGCRAEGHQPEEGKGVLEEPGGRDGEGDAGKRCPDEELHQEDPVALRPEEVDKGAPEGLDDPGKIEPACVKGDVGV